MNPKAYRKVVDLLCCHNPKYNLIVILTILFSICLVFCLVSGSVAEVSTTTPEKDTKLISGKEASDPGSPVLSVNSRQSIYYPGGTAKIMIVVLDSAGAAVSGAFIGMNVTAPDGSTEYVSTVAGSIVETPDPGAYETNYLTGAEGQYNITCTAFIGGGEIQFDTYFMVQDFYEFDIVRQAQSKIDPTKYDTFDVSVDITSHTAADTITIREYVPVNFTVHTDASVVEAAGLKVLKWQRNLADNKTSVGYSYSVPMVWPEMYRLGPVEIDYIDGTFTEARPWWVAVDPDDGSNCTECHDTSNTSADFGHIDYINYSLSIHGKISTNDTSTNPNEGCWACHGANSTGDHNESLYKNPYICEDCHVEGGVLFDDWAISPTSPALKVAEHYNNGINITASANENTTYSCLQCHEDINEMLLANNDMDNNVGGWEGDGYNLVGGSGSAYHYSKKRELGSGDAYCNYCHNNDSTVFPVTGINRSITTHNNTLNCNNSFCHNIGRIHDSPLDKRWRCVDCHTAVVMEIEYGYSNYAMDNDANNLAPYGSNMTHKRDTITSIAYGSDIESKAITYARHANPNSSGGWLGATEVPRDPNKVCINCHSDLIDEFVESARPSACNIACHFIYPLSSGDPVPNAHNLSVRSCSDCHYSYFGSTHDVSSLALWNDVPKNYRLTNLPKTLLVLNDSVHVYMTWDATDGEPTKQTGCLVCHTDVNFTMNYLANGLLNIIITDHSGIHTWDSQPDCTKCHSINDSVIRPAKFAHDNASSVLEWGNNTQCLDKCHNGTEQTYTDLSLALDRGHGHDVKPGAAGPNCISCHDQGTDIPLINVSTVRHGIHSGIQNYTNIGIGVVGEEDWKGDIINKTNLICWACHMDDGNFTVGPTSIDHADNLKFNTTPGTSDDDPYTCYDCHNSTSKPYLDPDETYKWWNVTEHFYSGEDLKAGVNGTSDNDGSCLICHNKSFMRITSGFESSNSNFSLVSHYGKSRSDLRTLDGGNTVNCSYCHNSLGTDSFNDIMINPAFNASVPAHSLNATKFGSISPNCTDIKCHVGGWMHNESLAKPALTTSPADSVVCLNCHGANSSGGANWTGLKTGVKDKHSGTLDCTECHLYEPRDIHGVKYLQKDDTYSTSNNTAVDCVRCHNDGADLDNISMFRPLVPTSSNFNFSHSEVPDNGSRWNETSYWGSVEGACDYCHGDTKHNESALGPIENIRVYKGVEQELNTSIDNNDWWCGGCHYNEAHNYNGTLWYPVPPTIVINNTGNSTAYDNASIEWFNHSISTYDDMICAACHGGLLSDNPTTKELAHNAAEGAFGPDCISCHDADSMSPKINVSVVNNSGAIHSNITNYPDSIINNPYPEVSDDNKICWACHMDNGSTPGLTAHADRWVLNGVDPYTCCECHVPGSINNYNDNLTALAPAVYEHYCNGSGLVVNKSINSDMGSCLDCHNESEMRLKTEFDGNNSNLSLVSHYGKNRSDIRTWTADSTDTNIINCSYCHSNESSVFQSYMRNINNSDIDEHSRYGSTPSCTNSTCHGGVRMHDASLAKPDLMINGTEDSGICLSCHDSTNYSTYMSFTTPKSRHNNTLNCSECHMDEARDIHGVKYLQQDNTYSMSNNSAVNCYICHSSSAVDSNITMAVPKVPDENYGFSHSDASTNGSRWNEMAYWNSTNEACEFCHNDTKHETLAIGPITDIQGSNTRNDSITDDSSSHWCSGCHISTATNYKGDQRTKIPPTIVINNTGNSTSWDGTGLRWFNHSTISNFNDTGCKGCHGGLLSTSPTTSEFVHKVAIGGGPDCISCHDVGAPAPLINVSVLNHTHSIHSNISTYANTTINNPYNISDDNKICWACHMDSARTPGLEDHADRLIQNGAYPYNCSECHVPGSITNFNTNLTNLAPGVYEHYNSGIDIIVNQSFTSLTSSCLGCHNENEMRSNTEYDVSNSALSLVSHYGKNRSDLRTWTGWDGTETVNCSYCHQNESTVFKLYMLNGMNSNISEHSLNYLSSTPNCTDISCHVGGWMHNTSLAKPDLMINGFEDSAVCNKCHSPDNAGGNLTATTAKSLHNDTLNCSECHLSEAQDIHGVKYLTTTGMYSTSISNAVNCSTCHSSDAVNNNITDTTIPKVPTNSNFNFNHSEDPDNGSRWNETSYWDSMEGACDYCHGDTKHNESALGPIEYIRDYEGVTQELNTSIDDNDWWCGGCHYQGAPNYNGTLWDPIPPTIVINNTGNSTAYDDPSVEWFNHSISSYDDMICAACHGSLLSDNPTTKEFAHNVANATFSADCISCHDVNRMSPLINVSVVNSSSAIHSNISNYLNSTINNPYPNVSNDNKICWACHMDNAGTPELTAHADRWIQNGAYPYNCSECHVNNVVTNLSGFIPVVEEHFYNGTNLVVSQNMTGNVSSCLACHNEGEMRLTTEFDDTNSNLSLVSHYGKNRSDLRTWTADGLGIETVNCSYCHKNDSSVFSSYMRELPNSVIDEHSRYGSTPNCTNTSCHVGGWMHEASLAKPNLMVNGTEDSSICLSCHDSANYSTYMLYTSPKSRHNDTLNCSECHLSEARDIHGVRYLQKNGTYSMSNSSAVDCYTCHSSGAVDNSINATIPKVPDNNYGFSHSDAPTSGSRWNATPYWNDNNGACEFCHNDTKHDTIAIGPIINIDENYSNVTLTPDSTSQLCSGCHIEGKIRYNAILRPQAPPTICVNNTGNSTSWDGTGQGWYDHSNISNFNDTGCKGCHGSLLSTTPTTTEFVHKVGEGGGKYCVECHDINGPIRLDLQIDVQAMNKSDAIHYDLNRAAIAEMDKNHSSDNVRCWACHGEGDGSDAAQPEGHPDRVLNLNPRNCSDMDCHNVNQSIFYEPMVYEHFMHVDIIDENVSTKADCPACHINSVIYNYDPNPDNSTNTSMASHYGSTHDLANTTSCIYCHLDEDNAEDWGNAPDPTTNISRLSDEELEETLFIGDKWHLGNRYFLVFNDISVDGDSAFLGLYHNDTLLEEIVVSDVYNFTYEDDFIDPDGDKESDVVVLELNFTAVFRGEHTCLVMVEGRSWKRIHPENKDPACWACHMDNHTIDKKKYLVLDEDEDNIYYLEKLLDFSDEDTEDKVTLTPGKLVLREGYNQTLDVDGDYMLTASEVDITGKKAYITLFKNGSVIEDSVYTEGEIIESEYDLSYDNHKINDFVIFTAKVDSIFHGYDTDIVSLTDVKVFSDRLMAADVDDDDDDIKVGGYNTSHLHINDTFSIGGYPDTFHVPPLNEGLDGGSDCVRCHDVSHRFGISSVDAIQSRLGGHSQLNANATSKDNTIDDINKACWACHGTGVDPERHPADYLYPRQCQDCHTDMEAPTYGAVDLSDENHGQFEDCNRCHAADYPGLHVINVFEPDIPYIVSINISSGVVTSGETVTVKAAAMASWNMKVKTIEYFIDVEGLPGTGTQLMPLDGTFDEQVEEVEFTIDTTRLGPGVHTIHLHAMERDNEWGPVNEAEFSIQIPVPGAEPESKRSPLLIAAIIIGIAGILLLLLRKSGYLFNLNEVPGNDSEKLLEHLEQNYGIDWAKTANIEKINNGKVVKVSTDENNLTLKLNNEKTRLYLNINGTKTDEFIVKMKDGELKIFMEGIRYRKGII